MKGVYSQPAVATADDVEAAGIVAQLREADALFTITQVAGAQDGVCAIDPHVQMRNAAIVQRLLGA